MLSKSLEATWRGPTIVCFSMQQAHPLNLGLT